MRTHRVVGAAVVAVLAGCSGSSSGGDPPPRDGPAVLAIDAAGVVTEAMHVTVNGGLGVGTTVSGSPISVDDVRDLPADFAATVTITNHSSEELRLGDVVPDEAGEILVVSDGGADVVVTGDVQAPAGSVTIRAGAGAVRSAGSPAPGVVRCNALAVEAAAIGAPDARLAVELRRSQTTETSLSATSAGDVFLDLAGSWSDWASSPPPADAPFSAGPVAAGGRVDVLLRAVRPEAEVPAGTYALGGLVAGGDVVLSTTDAEALGSTVHLTASTDVLGSGRVEVLSNGDVEVVESDGDLRVGAIGSAGADVVLRAASGSIVGAVPGSGTPQVFGRTVLLQADQGGIGGADPLEIDSSRLADGRVDAAALDRVSLSEVEGDLNVGGVLSRASGVVLRTSSGSILDADGDIEADVQATDIDLLPAGGGIGCETDDLEIYGAGTGQMQNTLQLSPWVPAVGRLLVESEEGVHLLAVNGALSVLRATSALGGLRLAVYATVYPHENLVLTTSGETQAGETVAGLVSAPLAVTLLAGDDVVFPAGALVSSNTSILLQGDWLAPDYDETLGSRIDVHGDLQAPTVEIVGGHGIDYLTLDNPDGINAGGTTLVSAGGAGDFITVRATAGVTTLAGGWGSDVFYVGAGDLSRIGPLIIDGGAGGNGGTRDTVDVDASAATAPLAGALDAGTVTGLGLRGDIAYSADVSLAVLVRLGAGDDVFQVTDPTPNAARIYGGPGLDAITGCAEPICIVYPD